MSAMKLSEEQDSAIELLRKTLGFDRVIIIGLDASYQSSQIFWRNVVDGFVPVVLKNQADYLSASPNLSATPK